MAIKPAYSQALTYSAAEDRLAQSAKMTQTTAAGLLPRDGVIPTGASSFGITASGMNLTVGPGQAVVAGYTVTSDETTTVAVTPSGATARTDLLVLRVYDLEAGDAGPSRAVLEMITGGSTTPPATPSRSIALAQVAVGASVSSLFASNISDRRTFTAAAGGVVPIAGALTSPSLAAGLVDGTLVWDSQAGLMGVKLGGTVGPYYAPPVLPVCDASSGLSALSSLVSGMWAPLAITQTDESVGTGIARTSSTDLTIQNAGGYVLFGQAVWITNNPNGRRMIGFNLNGSPVGPVTPYVDARGIAPGTIYQGFTYEGQFAAGTVVALHAYQDSGAPLNVGYRRLRIRRIY